MGLLPKKKLKGSRQNGDQNGKTEPEGSLSVFLGRVEEVSGLIENLDKDVEKVRRLQENILASPTPTDASKEELQTLTDSVRKTAFSVINIKLQEIGKYILHQQKTDETPNCEGTPSVGTRIARNQHAALAHKLKTLMEEFQTIRADYADKCKQRLLRQLQITGVGMQDLTSEQLNEMLDDENCSVFTQGIMQQTVEAQRELAEVTSRHDDIIKLEKSIRQLHELTLDIGNLVEIQGDTIDHIEVHINDAVEKVNSGADQLKKAKKSRNSARRKKIYLVTALLVIVAIVVLVVVLT